MKYKSLPPIFNRLIFIAVTLLIVVLLAMLFFKPTSCCSEDISSDELKIINKAAEGGDVKAMMRLYYFHGDNGDGDEARRWLTLAANMNDANAQDQLSYILLLSNKPEDTANGLRYLQSAAKAGLPVAQEGLGRRLRDGDGIPQDTMQAEYWYRKASDAGSPQAMLALANLLIGKNITQERLSEALRWNSVALSSSQIKKGSFTEKELLAQRVLILKKYQK